MLVPLFSQIDVAKEENIEEFIKLANEGPNLHVPNKLLGEFKLSSLPPEVQLDILKCFNFEELFSLRQTSFFFCNLIDTHEEKLARKKFSKISLSNVYISTYKVLSIDVKEYASVAKQFEKPNCFVLHTMRSSSNLFQHGAPLLFNQSRWVIGQYFVLLNVSDNCRMLKLSNIPKTIEEMIIARLWLQQLFECGFDEAFFGSNIFNPKMINLLFDNDKRISKKFNVNKLSLDNLNEDIFEFALNHFSIYELSINTKTETIEKYNNKLFNIIINEGNRLPRVSLGLFKSSKLYDLIIGHITTPKDFSNMVYTITLFYGGLENFKLPYGAVLVGTEYNNNKEYTKYQIANIYSPKMNFYLYTSIGPSSSVIIKKVESRI
uniref:F-box domain-containing protein n=1 Tax=Meloidogyne enterolobii TaxID=390850 RepID=A0A6V7V6N9_MELEN|nr:unnamed protein product [Meloidogyne enterolobii]